MRSRFAENVFDEPESFGGAGGEVVEVADGGGDDEQSAGRR